MDGNSLMTKNDWERVKWFSPEENWGDPYRIYKKLIFMLDAMRDFAGVRVIIHCAYETSGHSPNSYHYKGMAVDLHFEGLNLLDQFIIASRWDFGGIGVYPFWKNPGLHVDIRPIPEKYTKEARWWRDAAGKYHPLSREAFLPL